MEDATVFVDGVPYAPPFSLFFLSFFGWEISKGLVAGEDL